MTFLPTKDPRIQNYGLGGSTNALASLSGPSQQPQAPQQKQQGPVSNALSGIDAWGDKHFKAGSGPIADVVHGFARGFNPEAYDAGRQRRMDEMAQQEQGQKQRQMESAQVALAFGQHMKSMPEQQRIAFVQQNWDRFGPMMGANGTSFEQWYQQNPQDLTDAGLDAEIMQIQSMMGQGPAISPEVQRQAQAIRQQYGDDAYYAFLNNPEEFGKSMSTGVGYETINNQRVQAGQTGDFRDPMKVGQSDRVFNASGTEQLQGQDQGYVDRENQSLAISQQNADTSRINANKQKAGIRVTGPDGSTISIGGDAGLPGPALPGFGSAPKGKDEALVEGAGGETRVTSGPQQERANKAYQSILSFQAQNDVVMQDIDRALENAGVWTTGFVGQGLEGIPGTPAHDFDQTLTTIRANVGFDKLQNMREVSPTGGALGNVSNMELTNLQAVMGSLENSQSKEQLVFNLQRLKALLQGREQRLLDAYRQDFPTIDERADFTQKANRQKTVLENTTTESVMGMSDEELDAMIRDLENGQ